MIISKEEWLHSDYTVVLVRQLEKKCAEFTAMALDSTIDKPMEAAFRAGQASFAKYVMAVIREKKGDEE